VVIAIALLAAATVVATRTVLSSAAFSDSERLGVNEVGSATVGIGAGNGTVEMDIDAMAPGDSAVTSLDIVNDGSIPLHYTLSSEITSTAFARHVTADVWRAASCGRPGGPIPDGAETLARSVPLLGAGSVSIFGDPSIGRQAGDRRLEPGERDRLCYAIRLSTDAGNTAQGLDTTQVLTVYAEQATP
jgi:hypothetical protein